MKILFFDVETTGLDPKIHEIVQLAYVLDVDGNVAASRSLLMRPLNPHTVSPEALTVQSRTMDELMAFPHPFEAYTIFLRDMGENVEKYNPKDKAAPCAYNAPFDISFLQAFFQSFNDPYLGSWISLKRTIDPLPVVRMLDSVFPMRLDDFKLETIARYYDVPIVAHDAMSDVTALRDIYYKLTLQFKK